MSLYIHKENQKLIWESLQQIPQFHEFTRQQSGKQEEWFKEIIQQFYESNKFKLLTLRELQQLNRETVSYMINDMNQYLHPPKKNDYNSVYNSNNTINSFSFDSFDSQPVTREAIQEKKQQDFQKGFLERQEEYNKMLNRTPQKDIDFSEKIQEDPIDNLEALIKKKIEEREYDIAENNTPQNIDLNVVEIKSDHEAPKKILKESTVKKSVRWNDSLEPLPNQSNFQEQPSINTDSIQAFMEELRSNMNNIQGELLSLKQSFREPRNNEDNLLKRMKRKPVLQDIQDVTNNFI